MSVFIGVMTGTSIDGLDVAAIELDPRFKLVARADYPMTDALRDNIRTLARNPTVDWQLLGKVDVQLGEFIGDCVNRLIHDNGIDRAAVSAVGSHGQTVHHSPDTVPAFTVQIGDASRICERTGLTVVSDFRRADMAAGGQGAPLVPPFHQLLFSGALGANRDKQDIAVCNIGGIANVTMLPSDKSAPLLGFDTGPGNTLLDAWCQQHQNQAFDADGAWAASGRSNPMLLSALLGDPFVQRAPPKSTGVEHYNLQWLSKVLSQQGLTELAAADIQATLSEFTARSITSAVRATSPDCGQLILCGGGRRNGDLTRRIEASATCPAVLCDELADNLCIDGDALEAAAFAWLASQTLANLPGNAPSVTGATKPMRLGTVTAPL